MSCENCQLIERMKNAEAKIDKLQDDQAKANVTAERTSTTLDYIKKAVDDLKDDFREVKEQVKQMAEVPQKRWDTVVNTIIVSTVSSIVGAIIAIAITTK